MHYEYLKFWKYSCSYIDDNKWLLFRILILNCWTWTILWIERCMDHKNVCGPAGLSSYYNQWQLDELANDGDVYFQMMTRQTTGRTDGWMDGQHFILMYNIIIIDEYVCWMDPHLIVFDHLLGLHWSIHLHFGVCSTCVLLHWLEKELSDFLIFPKSSDYIWGVIRPSVHLWICFYFLDLFLCKISVSNYKVSCPKVFFKNFPFSTG